jgi:translation initiation factor 1A
LRCLLPSHLVLSPGVSQGGKNRWRGKNENDDDKRELVFRGDGQEYAQVIKMLRSRRLEAMCFDGEKRLAHIRYVLFPCAYPHIHLTDPLNQVCVNQGDIILLSLREFQDRKADVIHGERGCKSRPVLGLHSKQMRISYTRVKAYGELPENQRDGGLRRLLIRHPQDVLWCFLTVCFKSAYHVTNEIFM